MEALLLAALLLQLALRLAGRPSLASRLLPLPHDRPPWLAWAGRLWLSFALPALAALFLLGRSGALWRTPPELDAAVALARTWGRVPPGPIVAGLLIGSALSALVASWRARRGGRAFHLGRPARLPRSPAELPGAAAVAVSAGVAEELYFRLALPLLVAAATGSALLAVGASAAVFGAMHRYQGWVGVVATGAAGLFLHWIHLGSGQLWLAVLAHALMDVNGLVVRPALRFGRLGEA